MKAFLFSAATAVLIFAINPVFAGDATALRQVQDQIALVESERKSIENIGPKPPTMTLHAPIGGVAMVIIHFPNNKGEVPLSAITDNPNFVSIDELNDTALLVTMYQTNTCANVSVATTENVWPYTFCSKPATTEEEASGIQVVTAVAKCLKDGGRRDRCEAKASEESRGESSRNRNTSVFLGRKG